MEEGEDDKAQSADQPSANRSSDADGDSTADGNSSSDADDSFLMGEIFQIRHLEAGATQDHGDQEHQQKTEMHAVDEEDNDDEHTGTDSNSSEWVDDDDDSTQDYILHQPRIKKGNFILMFCKLRDGWI